MRYTFPHFKNLKAFEAAAFHLNLKEAAQDLLLSPGEIEFEIKQLEKFLGKKLILLHQTHIELTQTGKELALDLSYIFNSLQKTIYIIKNNDNRHIIHISLPFDVQSYLINKGLGRFMISYPNDDIRFCTYKHEPDFEKDNLDLAIVYTSYDSLEEDAYFLDQDLHEAYINPSLIKQTQENLNGLPLLHSLQRPDQWKYWAQARSLKKFDSHQGIYCDSDDELIKAALSGKGAALLTPDQIKSHDLTKKLQKIPLTQNNQDIGYYLKINKGSNKPILPFLIERILMLYNRNLKELKAS